MVVCCFICYVREGLCEYLFRSVSEIRDCELSEVFKFYFIGNLKYFFLFLLVFFDYVLVNDVRLKYVMDLVVFISGFK